ncbi:MAG: rhodanese-like domain-containing protein [Bacillota bacterium]|nr:rhodanese-like domain-containing protein [Bacillota bacterium]
MRKLLPLLALVLALTLVSGAMAATLPEVNDFLNNSAKLGPNSKANPVAVIPFHHIDGPQEEDLFYAFVNFKYQARGYIKYQVSYVSCTCRSADVNYWSTMYVDLTLPESGLLDDAEIRTLSYEKDGTGKYQAGFWGDSNPVPTGGQTYEMIRDQYLPYYVGKTYGELKTLSTIADIKAEDYAAGEGRADLTLDTWTGATVSVNNVLRVLQAIFEYHGTDAHFANDPSLVKTEAPKEEAAKETEKEAPAVVVAAGELAPLPAPVDETKTFLKNKDDKEEVPCTPGDFGPTCSAITAENLKSYLNRPDVYYIDLRDHNDYMKKHLRNFEVIPFFGLIFNANAHTDATLPQLYGGTTKEPVPVYEESDSILETLFPKDKTLFIMCQAGGRVGMLMDILAARGWDMSKVYNIGGMAQFSGPEYRDLIVDTPEMILTPVYSMEGLTRIAP